MPGVAERVRQGLTLGLSPLMQFSFDLERKRWQEPLRCLKVTRPIFLIGAAGGGVCVLAKALRASGDFASTSEADFPFPLAPKSWSHLTGTIDATQDRDWYRAKGIEELFWRMAEGPRYRRRDYLAPVVPLDRSIADFRDYVGLILLARGKGRYLSHNVNNLLRLSALLDAFGDALLVHPFGQPLQQALAMRDRHEQACARDREDALGRGFRTWIGMHELGTDQRPFLFDGAPDATADRNSIDYWLQSWISMHEAMLYPVHEVRGRQLFIDRDAICAEPLRYGPQLAELLGVSIKVEKPVRAAPRQDRPTPALLARAEAVHARLVAAFRESFEPAEAPALFRFGERGPISVDRLRQSAAEREILR